MTATRTHESTVQLAVQLGRACHRRLVLTLRPVPEAVMTDTPFDTPARLGRGQPRYAKCLEALRGLLVDQRC